MPELSGSRLRDNPPPSWQQRLYTRREWHLHRGVRVATTIFNSALEEIAFAKVDAALDVLHATSPRQLERILKLQHSLAITRLAAALGRWQPSLRVALLDRDFVLASDTTPQRIASVIVHELTHARLENAGFRITEATKVQSERICCLAERNFIARLPASEERTRLAKLNDRYLRAPAAYWLAPGRAEQLAIWRAKQPTWRRVLFDAADFLRRGHRAALSNER